MRISKIVRIQCPLTVCNIRLKPHYKTLIWGICTAGTLFASFRISKFAGSLSRTKSGAYQFEKLNNLQGQSKPQQKLSDALSIPIDIFLSLLVGASASLFLTDEVKMQNDLADIPLVKGRSLVSDELCTDFIKEYNNMPPQIWTSKNAAESTSMQAIKTFIENCNKRERLVSDRQKNGMDFKEAAKIPSPGVPHHIPGINRDYSQENS